MARRPWTAAGRSPKIPVKITLSPGFVLGNIINYMITVCTRVWNITRGIRRRPSVFRPSGFLFPPPAPLEKIRSNVIGNVFFLILLTTAVDRRRKRNGKIRRRAIKYNFFFSRIPVGILVDRLTRCSTNVQEGEGRTYAVPSRSPVNVLASKRSIIICSGNAIVPTASKV